MVVNKQEKVSRWDRERERKRGWVKCKNNIDDVRWWYSKSKIVSKTSQSNGESKLVLKVESLKLKLREGDGGGVAARSLYHPSFCFQWQKVFHLLFH